MDYHLDGGGCSGSGCNVGRWVLMIPFPDKKYNTVVIDPPWEISLTGTVKRENRAKTLPYKTMTLSEIKELPIQSIINTGGHLYLWVTNKTLRDGYDVLDAWGIRFHLVLPLVKPSGIAPCMGYVFASEFCLLGFAGKPMQKFTSIGALNWFNHKTRVHSTKPDEFYTVVERMSPSPRIDMFARRQRIGWDAWGDEV